MTSTFLDNFATKLSILGAFPEVMITYMIMIIKALSFYNNEHRYENVIKIG